MADPRVQAAITHWAGRFVANGIDYNDFVRTTGAISRWDEWLDAWSATAEGHVALAESALAAGHRRSAGEAYLLLIPGLDSTKEEFFHWESVFLDRGMATLSLDGPGQGETGFALNIRPDYDVAVAAILDAVADRPRLDQDRIGAVGVSLGGHYVIRAAAFEPRLKAVAGTHVCNNIPFKYRPLVSDWIRRQLGDTTDEGEAS